MAVHVLSLCYINHDMIIHLYFMIIILSYFYLEIHIHEFKDWKLPEKIDV
jgi:hypothetical protein